MLLKNGNCNNLLKELKLEKIKKITMNYKKFYYEKM